MLIDCGPMTAATAAATARAQSVCTETTVAAGAATESFTLLEEYSSSRLNAVLTACISINSFTTRYGTFASMLSKIPWSVNE